jgi:hypothetical protein
LSGPAFDFFLSLEYQNQNFGNRVIERAGNFISDVDGLVERLRKRPVLHHRNVMIASDFLDLHASRSSPLATTMGAAC